jgi:hypothetical protein
MKLPAVLAALLLSLSVGVVGQTPPPDANTRRFSQDDLDQLKTAILKVEAQMRSVAVVPLDATRTRVSFRDEASNVWVIESPSVTVTPGTAGMTVTATGGTVIRPKTAGPVPFEQITVEFQGERLRHVTVRTSVQ